MYGKHLGQSDQPYFGPPPPGQTWGTYEDTQAALAKQVAMGVGTVAAFAVHPVLGLAVGIGSALLYGGSGMHQNKPKQQGG